MRSFVRDLCVNSSVLLLGSLPGRTSLQLDRQLRVQWTSGATGADVDDEPGEMIFFHKSECTGSCPASPDPRQVISRTLSAPLLLAVRSAQKNKKKRAKTRITSNF